MTNKILGASTVSGFLGESPDWVNISCPNGRTLQSVLTNGTVQYWRVEQAQKTGGELLADGNYANPVSVAGNSLDNANAIKAILVGQGLSGEYGYFADGFTLNDPLDVGIDASYQFWKYVGAEALPYAVPQSTDPSAGDWELVRLNDHNRDINRDAIGAHDNIYTRTFSNISNLVSAGVTSEQEGLHFKTQSFSLESDGGGGSYRIITKADADAQNVVYWVSGSKTGFYAFKFVSTDYVAVLEADNNELRAEQLGIFNTNTDEDNSLIIDKCFQISDTVTISSDVNLDYLTVPDGKQLKSDLKISISIDKTLNVGVQNVSAMGVSIITPLASYTFNTQTGESIILGKKAILDVYELIGAVKAINGAGALSSGIYWDGGDFPTVRVNWKMAGFISALKVTGGAVGSGLTVNRGSFFVKWLSECQNAIEKTNSEGNIQIDTDLYIEKCATGFKGAGSFAGNHSWRFDDVTTWIENTGTGAGRTRLGDVRLVGHTYPELEPKINNRNIHSTIFRCRDTIVSSRGYNNDFEPAITSLKDTHLALGRNVKYRTIEADANGIIGTESVNDYVGGATITFGNSTSGGLAVERANRTLVFAIDNTGTAHTRGSIEVGTVNGIETNVTINFAGDFINRDAGRGLILKTPDNSASYRLSIDNSGNLVTTLIP